MPTWSDQLPSEKKHMGYDLIRTPTSASLQAIITCEKLLVCDTHFWGGRTMPCERSQTLPDGTHTAGNCPACNEAMPFRTHAYVSAYDCKTREHFIFECTAHAAKPLEEYYRGNKTLRGCVFHATRPKGLKNARVVIETNTANLAKFNLPTPPSIILALTAIWRLPLTGLAIEDQRHHSPEVRTRKAPLNRMRNQPDNQPDPPTIGDVLTGNDGKKPAHATP